MYVHQFGDLIAQLKRNGYLLVTTPPPLTCYPIDYTIICMGFITIQ